MINALWLLLIIPASAFLGAGALCMWLIVLCDRDDAAGL